MGSIVGSPRPMGSAGCLGKQAAQLPLGRATAGPRTAVLPWLQLLRQLLLLCGPTGARALHLMVVGNHSTAASSHYILSSFSRADVVECAKLMSYDPPCVDMVTNQQALIQADTEILSTCLTSQAPA